MLAFGPFLTLALVFLLLVIVIICGAAGAAIAYCAARIQRRQVEGWWKNSVLSASGFLAGFYFGLHIVHPTTISYMLESGTSVTETQRYYRHPEYIGYALAVLLPIILELCRFSIVRKPKQTAKMRSSNGPTS
jgi:hypothetical protein